MVRVLTLPLVLVVSLAAVACGGDDATSTSPSTTPVAVTELYAGSLDQRSSGFYSFTVNQAGATSLTLASMVTARFAPSSAAVRLGVGTPAGEGCGVEESVMAAPGLTAQLTTSALTVGIHCVELLDVGNLAGPVSFTVRIVHF